MTTPSTDIQVTAFIMKIFNVPKEIQGNDLRIDHDNIEYWELMDVATEKGKTVANVTFHTDTAMRVADLEGEISVWSGLHDVQGVDVEIAVW